MIGSNRWDDDVVFKNQARGTEDKRKKEFVNVCMFDSLTNHQSWVLTTDVSCYRIFYVRISINGSWSVPLPPCIRPFKADASHYHRTNMSASCIDGVRAKIEWQ